MQVIRHHYEKLTQLQKRDSSFIIAQILHKLLTMDGIVINQSVNIHVSS